MLGIVCIMSRMGRVHLSTREFSALMMPRGIAIDKDSVRATNISATVSIVGSQSPIITNEVSATNANTPIFGPTALHATIATKSTVAGHGTASNPLSIQTISVSSVLSMNPNAPENVVVNVLI